jgi:hypothetical protein
VKLGAFVSRSLPVLAAALVTVSAPACRGSDSPPAQLLDGTPAMRPSVKLRGVAGVQIATKVRADDARLFAESTLAAQCVRRMRREAVDELAVARVGVAGESATFRTASGRSIVSCDDSAGSHESLRRWCGDAFGRLEQGRLLDPRVDLAGCRTGQGDPVAFAWIDPGRAAQYVAVRQRGFVEVYRVAADLPVRVATTSDIDQERSLASFHVTEHDRTGRILRAYTLDARVAG